MYAPHTTALLSMQAANKHSAAFIASAPWPALLSPCGTVVDCSPVPAGGFTHHDFPLLLEKSSQKGW